MVNLRLILGLGIALGQLNGIGKEVWWFGWGYACLLLLVRR